MIRFFGYEGVFHGIVGGHGLSAPLGFGRAGEVPRCLFLARVQAVSPCVHFQLMRIDNLQYANWSPRIFEQMRAGGLDAVHVTIAYHENFRETVLNIESWNRWFENYPELIFQGHSGDDVTLAHDTQRTAIFFGTQNPSVIEDDIGLVEICHKLGIRFMQLSYNNQSLLATGCYESEDPGLTRMGREVIEEMNRVGMIVDMSHSSDRSTIEAAETSTRPIAITHANPARWHAARRNKSDAVIRAVTSRGGMLGFSLYPHHLNGGSECTLDDFCQMIADTADRYGASQLGIGSDLCQDQPDSVVEWMRVGRWTKKIDYGEGTASAAGFPAMPSWFKDNTDFDVLQQGLTAVGFTDEDVAGIMGDNWHRFYRDGFAPAKDGHT